MDRQSPASASPHRAEVLVSFEHTYHDANGDDLPHVLPTAAEYEEAVRAFLDRYKRRCHGHARIRAVTPWNEPNIGCQPTHRKPQGMKRAGVYWNRLNRLCKLRNSQNRKIYNCVVAAGDFVDDSTMFAAIKPYKQGMSYGSHKPAVWAFHPYHTMHLDAASAKTRTDRFLNAIGQGPSLWLTEGGGRVNKYRLARAKRDLCNLMKFAAFSDRIKRIYQYQLIGPAVHDQDGKDPHDPVRPTDTFDSALVENAFDSGTLRRRSLYDVFRFYSASSGTNPC